MRVIGRRLCARILRPMTLMAQTARAMTPDDREGRLPSPGTGDELEDLASSFNDLLGRLHEAMERQRRFTGDASHQLRTPLTALLGQIDFALRRERTAEDYRRALDQARGEAVRLHQIVEALLFLARAESDCGCPGLEPVDLASWVPLHLRHWSEHPRGADIRWEGPDGPAWAAIHQPLLGQLLDNLLENACKYSDPGTPIRVRLGREPGGSALVVEDAGDGLAPDELPHLFEPFYRSPRARRRGAPGVGLGLAVVRRIAETFCGSVVAEGAPGRGSRFVVRLPEADEPAEPVRREATEPSPVSTP
jgi:signal transduction histidine kinase